MSNPYWLSEKERIIFGAFYTPEKVVAFVRSLLEDYLKRNNIVVLDPAGGCGSFIDFFKDVNYRVGEIDTFALSFLRKKFNPENIFQVNVLDGISRKDYNIPENAFLIVVGNPPYNDWSSLYKKGQKGKFKMNEDIFDRDLGIAFLKAIKKLNPNIIAILHPLSYLIKKTNFKRLSSFLSNYRLIKGYLFPSYWFSSTSKQTSFPILIALYEKGTMNYEDVLNFEFVILTSGEKFVLSKYRTTDGLIQKYPVNKSSSLNLYFHTFRDLNSLIRNRDFLNKQTKYTIPVEPENLPYYSYLICLKYFIKEIGSKNFWLFGNLSPLIDVEFFQRNKNAYVWCAYSKSKDFQKIISREQLRSFYEETFEEEKLKEKFKSLFSTF